MGEGQRYYICRMWIKLTNEGSVRANRYLRGASIIILAYYNHWKATRRDDYRLERTERKAARNDI